ncbi:hypothetical protein [Iamia sp.]|uniref:hypothetical protein n=1 Tax=Iamia sp. TaxID=2722710 RepID=UPI002BFC932D|nr:hypothetical protein [Iamia sp.]HXH56592.1 hypothetical protein [Iamia sp.]
MEPNDLAELIEQHHTDLARIRAAIHADPRYSTVTQLIESAEQDLVNAIYRCTRITTD